MAVCSGLRVEESFPEKVSQRIRTVVVDGSDAFVQIICELLDFGDAIDLVAACSDGVEAIGIVARVRAELVVMDAALTGLDGLTVTTLLSDLKPAPTVVLMSTEDTPRLRAACQRAGAFALVNKANFIYEFSVVLQRMQERDVAGEVA